MRTRVLAASSIGVLAALLLAACASGGGSPTSSPSPTPSASASASASPTSPPPTDPNAPTGQCADSSIQVTVVPDTQGSSAGHTHSLVVFTNTGDAPCELRGAPGVSVVDANGTQIGEPADQQESDAPPTITIQPGATAVAGLDSVNIGTDGGPLADSCPTVVGAGYLVYPPHSFTAVEVPGAVPACESSTPWMVVGAVEQG